MPEPEPVPACRSERVACAGVHGEPLKALDRAPACPAWRTAFESQASATLLRGLKRCARRHLGWYRGSRNVSSCDVEDLVANALGDTWAGRLRWVPSRRTLEQHLQSALWYRARNGRRAAALDRTRPLEEDARGVVAAEREAFTDAEGEAALVDRVVGRLRALCPADQELLSVLSAYEAGVFKRRDLLAHTGLSLRAYRATVLRLRRQLERLDPCDLDVVAELLAA